MNTLAALLDAGAAYDAEYAGGLSNHLPMTLQALQGLGADDGLLRAFAERHGRRLEPAPPAGRWPSGEDWTVRLADRDAWPEYRSYFLARLEQALAG